jgi:hypothetical protein
MIYISSIRIHVGYTLETVIRYFFVCKLQVILNIFTLVNFRVCIECRGFICAVRGGRRGSKGVEWGLG